MKTKSKRGDIPLMLGFNCDGGNSLMGRHFRFILPEFIFDELLLLQNVYKTIMNLKRSVFLRLVDGLSY